MARSLSPIGDRIIVEPKERRLTTSTGIHLPEGSGDKPQEGVVLEIGEGASLMAYRDVRPGDHVLYAKYAGTEVQLAPDKVVLILKSSDILALVEGEA